MPQVDDLRAGRLENTPHNVDCSVVAIKEGGGCYYSDAIFGKVYVARLCHEDPRTE